MFQHALLILVLSRFSLSLTSTCSLFTVLLVLCPAHQFPQCPSPPRVKTTALTHNEEYCPVAIFNPLTGYERQAPRQNSTTQRTSPMIFQDESGDIDTGPSYSCDVGNRRCDYRESDIFTTVHSRARRTSEPETSLSLS